MLLIRNKHDRLLSTEGPSKAVVHRFAIHLYESNLHFPLGNLLTKHHQYFNVTPGLARGTIEPFFGNYVKIIYIGWKRLFDGWIKFNCDGACKGNILTLDCGGLICNSNEQWIKGYAKNIGSCDALQSKDGYIPWLGRWDLIVYCEEWLQNPYRYDYKYLSF